ncbi:MAG: hypothetical protein RLZZ299_468 [Pseudomonadota bacterium]|jgi:type II secretion system protein C
MDDELPLAETPPDLPEVQAAPVPVRRVLLVGAALALAGVGSGALAARGVGRMLALPGGETLPTYQDVAAPAAAPAAGTEAPARAGEPGSAEPPAEAPAVEAPQRPVAMPRASYVDPIVRRSIFDSAGVYRPGVTVVGEWTCRADANVRLLATIVAIPERFSSALLALGAAREAKADGFAIGDEVPGGGRIARIEQKKVCMEDGTCVCIGEQAPPAPGAAVASASGEGGTVEKIGENKYQVDRSLLDSALGNLESFAGQLRAVPHKDGSGNVDGFRLSAIRKGSLFDKLGIKNGDVVHAINGQAMTSTEGALALYQSLRNEKAFNFEISRRNQRQTLDYEVR